MPRRLWSAEEDAKLFALVEQYEICLAEKAIGLRSPKAYPVGQARQACRKRWFYSLDPKLRKGRWTKEEDEILLDAYQRLGPAWKEIALLIEGWTNDQCAKRYTEMLDPSVENRLRAWSQEEDQYLITKVKELGHKWSTISSGLQGRPPLTCQHRWEKLGKELASMPNKPGQDQDSSTKLSLVPSGSDSVSPGSNCSGNVYSTDNGPQDDAESHKNQLDGMDRTRGLEDIFLPQMFDVDDLTLWSMNNREENYTSVQDSTGISQDGYVPCLPRVLTGT
ncbi:hypothetical protein ASPBRDRAFT_34446 [Aspergillus brasiliensis CBS 101740]|uniref:Myb-like transcription factor n=1 Tax=Aspergillus brasiliensis (strain CBS 101740 / IMI 381727 / IBT 21946) TaxID=767769 RepID=A0A1L9U637_ASPBC|nr:hypothetical protein ASPBRDRAFT_34446 [Aspergillus brasiliensis CBS 101740]